MKKFKDCKIDDEIFSVREDGIEVDRLKVVSISQENLIVINSKNYKRKVSVLNRRWAKQEWPYGREKEYIFVKESDAIQYSKSVMMNRLQSLINKANESLDKVEEFRIKHWEELNHDFLDPQIRKLQRRERESLYK